MSLVFTEAEKEKFKLIVEKKQHYIKEAEEMIALHGNNVFDYCIHGFVYANKEELEADKLIVKALSSLI